MRSIATLATVILLAACSTTPPAPAPTQQPVHMQAPMPAPAAPSAVPAKTVISELDDPASPLAKRSVYFPFDSFAIDQQYGSLIKAHGLYMMHHPTALTIEGNADERGSREYNLALGQKRADAVRRALAAQGAQDKQMEAISYGKERPKATCHEESCWSQNRRADLVYPTSH